MTHPIYLDYASTTPVDAAVVEEMIKHLTIRGNFGNPSSKHYFGLIADSIIEDSRAIAANFLGCKAKEIIFTSGATEAINLAIKGIALANQVRGNHIITTLTEHKAVLDACRSLEKQGYIVTYLIPDSTGNISIDELERAIRPTTTLVSIMHVNNETGVIQNISPLGDMLKKYNVYFHVDAAQSFGKLPIDLGNSPIDLLSCSAHKIYGPKGVGLLYIKDRARTRISPLIDGGGQEFGIRPGTLPTHQIAGFGKAIEIARDRLTDDYNTAVILSDILKHELMGIGSCILNSPDDALPNIINISFFDIDSVTLVTSLQNDVAISNGSACTSGSIEPSHVLRGMGIEGGRLHGAIRISFGRYTTKTEIENGIKIISNEVNRIRNSIN